MSHIHIYAPAGRYISQVRRYGHRRWEHIAEHKTLGNAASRAANRLASNQDYKRARVLFCAEWHEPHIAMEMNK